MFKISFKISPIFFYLNRYIRPVQIEQSRKHARFLMQVFGGFFCFECNIPIFLRILLFKLENVKKNSLTIYLPIEQQKIPYLGKRTQEM